jgi:hypothetical protein
MAQQIDHIDRTRVIVGQRCPRRRWWGYDWQGRGVSPTRVSLPLVVGRFTHEGLERILRLTHAEQAPPDRTQVRGIVGDLRNEFQEFCETRGVQLEDNEDEYLLFCEQSALVEGMLWAYWQYALPKLLEGFEILEVEKDEAHPFVKERAYAPAIHWQSRADALLKSKIEGGVYVLSYKTAKGWDRRKEGEAETDMQGISEGWAVEQRLGHPISGVKMEHLIKGIRKPDSAKRWTQYSLLIRGWQDRVGAADIDNLPDGKVTEAMLLGAGGGEGTKARYWTWKREDENGKTKQLSAKKVEPLEIWKLRIHDPMAVERWVDDLAAGRIQGPNDPRAVADKRVVHEKPLEQQFVLPMPQFRNQEEQDEWLLSVQHQEMEFQAGRTAITAALAEHDYAGANQLLAMRYPKYTHSCNYPGRCEFFEVCHRGAQSAAETDPIAAGDFRWREPHHDAEMDYFQEQE